MGAPRVECVRIQVAMALRLSMALNKPGAWSHCDIDTVAELGRPLGSRSAGVDTNVASVTVRLSVSAGSTRC
jgi:hypothetical protein